MPPLPWHSAHHPLPLHACESPAALSSASKRAQLLRQQYRCRHHVSQLGSVLSPPLVEMRHNGSRRSPRRIIYDCVCAAPS